MAISSTPVDAKKTEITVSVVSYSEPVEQLMAAISSLCISLDTLFTDDGDSRAQLIVINNRPSSIEALRLAISEVSKETRMQCKVRIIEGHGNIGYGKAHNLAIKPSTSGYHLLMNPDVIIDPEALTNGIVYLKANPDVGVVSPNAIDQDGVKQNLCKRRPTILDLLLRGFAPTWLKAQFKKRLSEYEMKDLSEYEATKGVPIASGCFMLFKSDILWKLGGFNPKYFLYFEDFDLSIRASDKTKIAYLPQMRIVHLGGNSAKKGLAHLCYFAVSAFYFFQNYGWSWRERPIDNTQN